MVCCGSGGVLLSHTLAGAVPSALVGLASGFGMGPGVSPPLWPPDHIGQHTFFHLPEPPSRTRVCVWVGVGWCVGSRIVDAGCSVLLVVRAGDACKCG